MTQVVISNAEVRSRKWRWPALPASVVVALGWIAVMLVLACFSEIIAPYGFTKLDLRNRLAPPLTPGHWLGTDPLGQHTDQPRQHVVRGVGLARTLGEAG